MKTEKLDEIFELTKSFYIKHDNNVKIVCRETAKGITVLSTYSCKTLFSNDDISTKNTSRIFQNNLEFIDSIEKNNIDIKNIVQDKKYVIVAGMTDFAYVWLKYSCYVEYLITEKFTNALFLETSIIASGKEFMPFKLDIQSLADNKKVNLRISSEIIKIIDKRNIFFKF